MSAFDEWEKIPDILKRRLALEAAMILIIFAVGSLMEQWQAGQGFLKLTLLCVGGLLIRFLMLFRVIIGKRYEIIEGTVKEVRESKIRKRYCEIVLEDERGIERRHIVPNMTSIKKSERCRVYWGGKEVLGIEKLELYSTQI